MKKSIFALLPLALLVSTVAYAQQPAASDQAVPASSSKLAAGTIIPAELSKSLDAKKAKEGDPVEAKIAIDMLSNGKIILPRNTKVLGHVTSAKPHSKESPDSMIGIAFDKMVTKDGHEFAQQLAVQAIGAPMNAFAGDSGAPASPMGTPSGPIGGGGTGPGMGGATSGGQRTGGSAPTSYPPSGTSAGSPSAESHPGGALAASSQGVVGIKDLSLSATPQASVFTSSNKNVHLDGGAQLILRVQ